MLHVSATKKEIDMNTTAIRAVTLTAAIALTALGTVSVAQAKQGADDVTPQVQSSASSSSGHGADDLMPHVSGADDATPSARPSASPSASSSDDSTSHDRRGGHRHGGHRGAHHVGVHN
jgi:hypothetical protein